MQIPEDIKNYIKQHSEHINNEEWSKVFSKDIYNTLMFSEINIIYKMLSSSGIAIDLVKLAKDYNLLDTYLREPGEKLESFISRVERDFYDKFYTAKFSSIFKEKTFEEIYQSINRIPTLADSDFSGSNVDDKPTFIEVFLVLSEVGYLVFRVNFLNEDTDEQLIGYFETLKDSLVYLPFGVFYDYKQIRDDQNNLIQEMENNLIGNIWW